MTTITKGDFLQMVKLYHLEVLTQEQLGRNTQILKTYMEKALTSELSEMEKGEADVMIDDISTFEQWTVLRDDLSKAIVYTRREQIAWDEPQRGEFGEILKARGGVYKPTGENKKLGRVGQKYGESKEEKEDVKGLREHSAKIGAKIEENKKSTQFKSGDKIKYKNQEFTVSGYNDAGQLKIRDKYNQPYKLSRDQTVKLEESQKSSKPALENKEKVKLANLDSSKRDYLFQVVNYSKKPNLDDIDETEVKGEHAEQINKILDKLPEVDFKNDFTGEDLPDNLKGGVFIAKYKGKRYLVDTQGYDYVRYATQLVKKKSYTDMKDVLNKKWDKSQPIETHPSAIKAKAEADKHRHDVESHDGRYN